MGDYDRIRKEVKEFVEEVASAVREATDRLGDAGLRVETVSLELSTTVVRGLDGSLDLKIAEIGADVSKENSHTVSLEFKLPEIAELAGEVEDDLIDGIEVVEMAVAAAGDEFNLESGTVSAKVGRSKEGKVKIFIGAEGSKEYAHTVEFKLVPS